MASRLTQDWLKGSALPTVCSSGEHGAPLEITTADIYQVLTHAVYVTLFFAIGLAKQLRHPDGPYNIAKDTEV